MPQENPSKSSNTQSDTQTTCTENNSPQLNAGKGGKKKFSQGNQARPQPKLSTSGTNPQLMFQSRNLRTQDHTSNAQPVVSMTILGKTVIMTISAPDVDPDHVPHIYAVHHSTWETTLFVFTVAAHSTPWVTAPNSPKTTGRNPVLQPGTFTVKDQIMEQLPKIHECHKKIHQNHQISRIDDQDSQKMWEISEETSQIHNQLIKIQGIQEDKVTTSDKGLKIIETILFLTEITDMTKTTEMDINRQNLMTDTTNSTLQTTTNIYIDLLL